MKDVSPNTNFPTYSMHSLRRSSPFSGATLMARCPVWWRYSSGAECRNERVRHYFLRGKPLSETKARLNKFYSGSAPSYGMVQKWFTEFRCGRTSTETTQSPGRPNETTKPEMINKIHDIVLNDPKVKMRKIAEIVYISTKRVRFGLF